ncbi:hypothetical protein GQQ23_14530 [Pantoea agglomerans]|nr:hypothetical protein [Pantoea agglomerans]
MTGSDEYTLCFSLAKARIKTGPVKEDIVKKRYFDICKMIYITNAIESLNNTRRDKETQSIPNG